MLAFLCAFVTKSIAADALAPKDSTRITHTLDGMISEWKTDKFESDKETQVLYAVDHDAENIYLALKVPNQRTQMKMMMTGMNVYLDKKGKKREGTGIEFPVKRENPDGGFSGGRGANRSENGAAPDPKAIREKMAGGMIFLKTFGFDDQEDKTLLISQAGGVNIAFSWDDANILYVEYQVPISLLGKSADLKGKPLGIGWKINGISQTGNGGAPDVVGGARGGGRANVGGGRSGGGMGASGGSETAEQRDMAKEQSFWTKYTLN